MILYAVTSGISDTSPQAFLGKKLLIFLLHIDVKSKDPDKWLRPRAVQVGADCPALKAAEFNSFYFWLHKTVWFREERGLESAGILWISNIFAFACWRGTSKEENKT